ncbi:hypothetical protein ACXHXG_20325 [Rhizobium sp. LEGMi198b]
MNSERRQSTRTHLMRKSDIAGDPRLETRSDEIGKSARAVAGVRDAISAKAAREADAEAKRAIVERQRLEDEARERNCVPDVLFGMPLKP